MARIPTKIPANLSRLNESQSQCHRNNYRILGLRVFDRVAKAVIGRNQPRLVRPTLRCLREDLADEVRPAEVRRAVRTLKADMARDRDYLLPCLLVDVEHAVLDKANLVVADEAALPERIEVLKDRHAVKVKTSDRRGALWQDSDGTWWLLAAGRRKDDGQGDFYRGLDRFTVDVTGIAPTDEDIRYQVLESAYQDEVNAEREACAAVVAAIFLAARNPSSEQLAEVFGSCVSVVIVPDSSGCAALEVSWEFERFDQQDRFPMDVLAMVPGYTDIETWDYLPPRPDEELPQTWYTYVTDEWIAHMSTSAELDELLADNNEWQPVDPISDGSEEFSHYAQGSVVTLAYATGIEIKALCGASIVAHRDYEQFPICSTCEENLRLLQAMYSDGTSE